MQRLCLFLFLILSLSACQSAKVTSSTSDRVRDSVVVTQPETKFNLYLSGSGIAGSPSDEFKLDTLHMMSVKTAFKGSKGNWRKLNALARLEDVDYDTLRTLIQKGNLATLDSSDVTAQCPQNETYLLAIIPPGKPGIHLQFFSCATDYNLLLEPQRKYFKALIEWFERMRVKYRPFEPEQ